MILSRTFIIEKDKFFNEQFNLSTLLYNQGRHFINEEIIDRGLLYRPYRISFY